MLLPSQPNEGIHMRCPRDGSDLIKMRISYVCPNCSYKVIQPEKKVYPECGHQVSIPEEISWSSFTTSSITITNNVASLSTGQTSGYLISPQFSNRTKTVDYSLDVTKAIIDSATYSKNSGTIQIQISNDGGTTWLPFNDDGQEWILNSGNEGKSGGITQSLYYDLRIKITLSRAAGGDESPTFSNIKISHNYVGDTRKILKRDNLDRIIQGK